MSETFEVYHPLTRPPQNPSMRVHINSKECMQKNESSQLKQQSALSKVTIKQEQKSMLTLDPCYKGLERAHSLNNLHIELLKEKHRSLSASNLYALNNPNLSLTQALSKKAYDKPNTTFAKEKALFTACVQKYFYQLTVGCSNLYCRNKFCKSSPTSLNLKPAMAALISVELSGYKDQYLCIKEEPHQKAKLFNADIFKQSAANYENKNPSEKSIPFLYSFYSMSPFRSLFLPCPLTSSGKPLDRRHSHSVESVSSLQTFANTLRSHLNVITTTVSSSLSNIWKSTTEHQAGSECEDLLIKKSEENFSISDQMIFPTPTVHIFPDNTLSNKDEDFSEIEIFEASVAKEFQKRETFIISSQKLDEELVSDGYSLTHLTLDMFNTVLSNYYECTDESFLINTLRTVFSSWEALNISFSKEGLSYSKSNVFDIKCEDVESMFEDLNRVHNSRALFAVLIDAVAVMLLSRKRYILKVCDLKPLLIILYIPNLFDNQPVVHEISSIISELSKDCQDALSLYFYELCKEKFEFFIQVIFC